MQKQIYTPMSNKYIANTQLILEYLFEYQYVWHSD